MSISLDSIIYSWDGTSVWTLRISKTLHDCVCVFLFGKIYSRNSAVHSQFDTCSWMNEIGSWDRCFGNQVAKFRMPWTWRLTIGQVRDSRRGKGWLIKCLVVELKKNRGTACVDFYLLTGNGNVRGAYADANDAKIIVFYFVYCTMKKVSLSKPFCI